MLSSVILCAATGYIILRLFTSIHPLDIAVVAVASFVVTGFLVPRLVAQWLGVPLDEIIQP